ncbi:MAG: PaaI family thioesterase [Polyangiales bacterium]
MSRVHAFIVEAKRTGDWSAIVGAIPYARFINLSVSVSSGELICTMKFEDKLVGNYTIPALHGGTLGGLLESTAVFALLHAQETVVLPKIVNVTVDYLRSGRAVDTYAAANITRQGRRVASVQAFAWQEDRNRPIASANAHFLLEPPEDDAPQK